MILFEKEIINTDGLKLKITIFTEDGRSPQQIKDGLPERLEHIFRVEVYDEPTLSWIQAREERLEFLVFDRVEDGS